MSVEWIQERAFVFVDSKTRVNLVTNIASRQTNENLAALLATRN